MKRGASWYRRRFRSRQATIPGRRSRVPRSIPRIFLGRDVVGITSVEQPSTSRYAGRPGNPASEQAAGDLVVRDDAGQVERQLVRRPKGAEQLIPCHEQPLATPEGAVHPELAQVAQPDRLAVDESVPDRPAAHAHDAGAGGIAGHDRPVRLALDGCREECVRLPLQGDPDRRRPWDCRGAGAGSPGRPPALPSRQSIRGKQRSLPAFDSEREVVAAVHVGAVEVVDQEEVAEHEEVRPVDRIDGPA